MIEEAFNHDARWNTQSPGALSSTTIPDPLTTIGLPHSEPISAMRPAVYLPVTEQGRSVANENSSSLFGQELRESIGLPPGLYKAPDPDPQHTSGTHLGRAAQKTILPLLPELLGRAAQEPGQGQE